eukprot:361333-Chlamydomonas_euryale.AAC.4
MLLCDSCDSAYHSEADIPLAQFAARGGPNANTSGPRTAIQPSPAPSSGTSSSTSGTSGSHAQGNPHVVRTLPLANAQHMDVAGDVAYFLGSSACPVAYSDVVSRVPSSKF